MSDLISRQSAIDVIDKIFPADPMRNDYTQGITCGAALAMEYIKQLPPAQPEPSDVARDIATIIENEKDMRVIATQPEIIYCGDCKYKDDGIDEDGIPFLKCLHGRSYGGTRINDFCSWAERRTDG